MSHMIKRFAAKTATDMTDGLRNSFGLLADLPFWLLGIWTVALVAPVVGATG